MHQKSINNFYYYEVYYTRQSFRDVRNQRETACLGIYGARAPISELNMVLIASSDEEAKDTFIEWLIKQHKGKEKYPESYVDLVKTRFRDQKEVAIPPDHFYKISRLVKHPLKEFPLPKGLVLRVLKAFSHPSQTP